MNRKFLIITVALYALVALATPVVNRGVNDDKEKAVPLDSLVERNFQYVFMDAMSAELSGDYQAAFNLFRECLSLDSTQAEVYVRLFDYYREGYQEKSGFVYADSSVVSAECADSIALQYLTKAIELAPGNDYYSECLAQYYLSVNNLDAAAEAYEAVVAKKSDRIDVLELLVKLYHHQQNYQKKIDALNRLQELEGNSESLAVNKMVTYTFMDDKEKAYGCLRELVDEFPNDANYKLMVGNWLLNNNRPEEALEMFEAAIACDPNNENTDASLYDYYNSQGEDSMAVIYRDRILFNPKADSSTKLQLLKQYIRQNESEGGDSIEVLKLFDDVMRVSPKDADVAEFLAVYKTIKEMPEQEIIDAYQHVLDIAPDKSGARLQILQLLWPKMQWREIVNVCLPALEYNPDEMAFCYFLGMAYYQLDDHDAALEAFARGVSQINQNSDKEMASDFYTMMGDLLHQKGERQKSYEAYDNALKYKADNVGCLNNYAYHLSIENGDMDKAYRMALTCVSAEPTNPTYLDTFAWVLYQQERYTEARTYMERCLDNYGEPSAEVLEHAGDIYFKCGDIDKAVDLWNKAMETYGSDDEAAVKKVRKKIKKRKI